MDVTRTGGNNLSAANNIRIAGYSDRMLQAMKERSGATPDSEPAVMVEISEDGRLASMLNKEFDLTDVVALKVDEGLLGEQGPLVGHVRKQTLDMIHHRLPDVRGLISIDFLISDALEGEKINSPTATAAGKELASMIMANAYGNGSTVEERAMNRELGIKHAEHIAANYFEDKDEAKAFLDRMRLEYENDILREKGYEGVGMSNELSPQQSGAESNRKFIEPWKSYETPAVRGNHVSDRKTIFEYYEASDEIKNNPYSREADTFFYNLAMTGKLNGEKWQRDIIEAWEKNGQEVQDIIDQVRASVSDEDVANSWARILEML